MHAKRCRELGGSEGKCWFYGPGACAGCHTSIHITDVLPLEGQLSRYKAIIWTYVRAAPLRRNLLAMPFKMHLAVPHHMYQSAPLRSRKPSPWLTALCFNYPLKVRRIKQPLTPLTNSKTPHHPSVSVPLLSPSTW